MGLLSVKASDTKPTHSAKAVLSMMKVVFALSVLMMVSERSFVDANDQCNGHIITNRDNEEYTVVKRTFNNPKCKGKRFLLHKRTGKLYCYAKQVTDDSKCTHIRCRDASTTITTTATTKLTTR